MSSAERSPRKPGVTSGLRWFVGVPARRQTYFNLLYLLLAFPLGLAYFVFLLTGFSMGIATIILVFGLPVLLCTIFLATQLAAVERTLAKVLLGVEIEQTDAEPDSSIPGRIKTLLLDLGTWKGVVYLFSKFFLGLFAFLFVTIVGSIVLTLLLAPLHYQNPNVGIVMGSTIEFTMPELAYGQGGWHVSYAIPYSATIETGEVISTYANSVWSALAFTAIGAGLTIVVLHLFNAVAWLYARYTELMLRRTRPSIIRELRR